MRIVTIPAKSTLFDKTDEVKMSVDKQDIFHHKVTKLQYESKKARVYIDLVVSFMCTRVSQSTREDWYKLRRLLNYLPGTIDMPMIIVANGMDIMETYVDDSYAVHHDMRGRSVGIGKRNYTG